MPTYFHIPFCNTKKCMHVALFLFFFALFNYIVIHSTITHSRVYIMKMHVSLKPLLFVKWRKMIYSPNLTFDSEPCEVMATSPLKPKTP